MNYWKSVWFVFLGACSYGVLSTFVKLAYSDGFSVGGVTGSQMFLGLVLLFLLTIGMKKWERLNKRQWIMLTLVGFFIGLTGLFYYSSLLYIPASIAIILLFQFTWIGVLVEAIMQRKLPEVNKILSLILLFLGTLLAGNVLLSGTAPLPFIGVLFGLLAAAAYAGFIISSGKVAVEVNPWMRSLLMSFGSLIITWAVYPPSFLTDGSLGEGLWLWAFLLALFGIVIPNLLFTYGVPIIGAGLSTILGSAELPMAVLMSRLVLGENVALLQWIGVVMILLGIIMAEWKMNRRKLQKNKA